MIEYIYFVKCPDCEDEHFEFFSDAKEFALGCLTKQPIITQIEVCRNDFGECTEATDFGTIWSWEDMMSDVPEEPELTVFSRDELFDNDVVDAEFDALDNSLDNVPDNFCRPTAAKHTAEFGEQTEVQEESLGGSTGLPVPNGMSIGDLVEAMEENEDDVECTWCNELFDKSECRYEVDLGYLCSSCEAAIKSRGEPLTFRENNYWDFLDEDVESTTRTWTCWFDNKEVGTVEAASEDEALEKMQKEYPEFNYGLYDGCFAVTDNTESQQEAFDQGSTDSHVPEYEYEEEEEQAADSSDDVLTESAAEVVEFDYDDLDAEAVVSYQLDVDDFDDYEWTVDSYTLEVSKEQVVDDLRLYHVAEEDGIPADFDEWSINEQEQWVIEHFDALLKKYYDALKESYREEAAEAAVEDAVNNFEKPSKWDYYDESCNAADKAETLEESADDNFTECPECGTQSYDAEAGFCVSCGM